MFVEDLLRPTSSRFAATTLLLCVKRFVVKKVSTIVTFVVYKLSEDILSAPHKFKGVELGSKVKVTLRGEELGESPRRDGSVCVCV